MNSFVATYILMRAGMDVRVLIWTFTIYFSSPKHKVNDKALMVSYCDRPLSVVVRASYAVRRASAFILKHLLWNRSLDIYQTSQEGSMGGPLPQWFKLFQFVA